MDKQNNKKEAIIAEYLAGETTYRTNQPNITLVFKPSTSGYKDFRENSS